jgi:glycosyltransferase involved in cell wall biosynthesis
VFVLASTQYDLNGKKINEMCETFGLVLAEAMACGTPVIASKTGGIPDWIIDNYNGLLFNERDYRQLAKLIVSIIKEKKLAKNLVKNANIEISKKYSPKVVTMQYEKLYKGLN